jgi:hypothetical protein
MAVTTGPAPSRSRAPLTVDESIDELVGLATIAGANALARDALRSTDRFEQARLFVAIVGDAIAPIVERAAGRPIAIECEETVTIRDARGICFTAGALAAAWPANRRTDVILTDRATAMQLRTSSRVRVLVIDSELEPAFAMIDRLAVETDAVSVRTREWQNLRQLCARLACHLHELQCALQRSTEEMHRRINAITVVRVLAETLIDQRARMPDARRERLLARLEVERTKFLMATKADALVALEARVAALPHRRRKLREESAAIAHEIATDALADFWQRANATCVGPMVAQTAKELVDELVSALGDLVDALPLSAMAGVERIWTGGFHREEDGGAGVRLAHPLARRARIEAAAREELVSALELGSRRLVKRIIADCDAARAAVEDRFCKLIDGVLEGVRVGTEIARAARVDGSIRENQERIALWSRDLKRLSMSLDAHRA